MRRRFWLFLVGAWLLAACAPSTPAPPTPSPTPTVAPVVAAVSPDLEPAVLALRSCADTLGVPLAILTTPQSADRPSTANLRLWWGEVPPHTTATAYALASEHLVAVVSAENPAHPTEEALRRAVMGQVTSWEALQSPLSAPIALWLPLPDSSAGQRLQAWLGFAPRRGDASLAPDPRAMLQSVGSDQAALGFVPAGWLVTAPEAQQVRALDLAVPAWSAPLLALLTPHAPPSAQAMVGCLQQGPGHDLLQQIYPAP